MDKKNIVIIGAAGYVGIELVSQLQKYEDYNLYAYTRDNGSFLLENQKIIHLNAKEVANYAPFDIVINLAYPTVSQPTLFPAVNKSILDTIKSVTNANTRIIHVSTQAVFGFGMDKPIVADFLKDRRDFAYVEAKLSMENMIRDAFPSNDIAIVRLGNVWGPGSGTWTGAVADKLLFGQYVAVKGKDGYANITDVKNVASYLIHLANAKDLKGKHIYHLAEFSSVRWSQIINLMAEALHVEPVYTTLDPDYPLSLKDDVSKVLKFPSVGDTYRELVWGRLSGSYLRGLVRFLGTEKFQKLKKTESKSFVQTEKLSKAELTHLKVVSSDVEFKSVLMPDWKPLLTFEQSWQLVKEWMQDVGYIN